jgi:hypothetical protein
MLDYKAGGCGCANRRVLSVEPADRGWVLRTSTPLGADERCGGRRGVQPVTKATDGPGCFAAVRPSPRTAGSHPDRDRPQTPRR